MKSLHYFATVAETWDEMRAGYFTEAMRDDAIARAVLPGDALVADVGTGTGFMLMGLAHKVSRVVGFDASQEMLTVARRNLSGSRNVGLSVGVGEMLPAASGSFDAVFANMYLHHAPEPEVAIREMVRLLKPGGTLVITDLDAHEQEWMREAMADRWLGFRREDVRTWFQAAGLKNVEADCAAGTCDCTAPGDDAVSLSVFVVLGQKKV